MLVFLDTSLKLGALRELVLYMVIYINFHTVYYLYQFPSQGIPDYNLLPKINTELSFLVICVNFPSILLKYCVDRHS